MIKNKVYRKVSTHPFISCIFLAFLTATALLSPTFIPSWEDAVAIAGGENRIATTLAKLLMMSTDTHMCGAIIFAALIFLYYYVFQKRQTHFFNNKILIFSFLFSFLTLVGRSFSVYDNLDFLLGNRFQVVYSFLILIGYLPFYYVIIEEIFVLFDYISFGSKFTGGKVVYFLVDKQPFFIPFLLCLITTILIWLVEFPGPVGYDIMTQFDLYYGIYPLNDHAPIFSTFFYGFLLHIGRSIGSDNLGAAICAFFQILLQAFAIAFAMTTLKKWEIPGKIRLIALFFFAFHPIIVFFPRAVIKDSISSSLLLIFAVQFLEIVRKIYKKEEILKSLFVAGIVGFLSAQFRHNNIYIAAISLCVLLFSAKQKVQKLQCLAAGILCFICSTLFSLLLVNSFHASEGSSAEMLSIPFQQTARYIRDHNEEITEYERQVIDSVLDYNTIASVYSSSISDAVKATYKGDDSKLSEYFKVWFSMFLKHPKTYIEAFIGGSYLYYYPFGSVPFGLAYPNGMETNPAVNTGFFNFHFTISDPTLRMFTWNTLYLISKFPGISLLFHPGTFVWFLLIAVVYALIRKKEVLILGMTPAFMTFLCCIASPLNGSIRYSFPLFLMTPIILGFIVFVNPPKIYDKNPKSKTACPVPQK